MKPIPSLKGIFYLVLFIIEHLLKVPLWPKYKTAQPFLSRDIRKKSYSYFLRKIPAARRRPSVDQSLFGKHNNRFINWE